MSALRPAAIFGLEVPAGDVLTPAIMDFPATFRITMAALDPTAPIDPEHVANGDVPARATLKMLRQPMDDEESDEEDEEVLKQLLAAEDSDEDDEEDDESGSDDDETNGGPSDPAKTKKARAQKVLAELKKDIEDDEEMEIDEKTPNGVNGTAQKHGKGKGKALTADGDLDDDEEDEDEDSEGLDLEELVLCTLDPTKHYQQTLDITVNEHEEVLFKVTGSHSIFLTGNYVVPSGGRDDLYDSEDEDYDLSPSEDELDDEESDELDDLSDPRLTELGSSEDEETPPKLVKSKADKKGKTKRPAQDSDEEAVGLDEIMAKTIKTDGDQKLSKEQLKKLKNNAGEPVTAAEDSKSAKKDGKDTEAQGSKSDKKVQFAKNLEQGPTPTKEGKEDKVGDKQADKPKAAIGVKTVQGVTIDDRKLGTGPACKKGNKVSMRYIGKLQSNNFQFDANTKGSPFSFKLGSGEVIKGWDIGVAGMCVGGERRITIPANLAYGKKSIGKIPAHSTLVFDIKLLEIN